MDGVQHMMDTLFEKSAQKLIFKVSKIKNTILIHFCQEKKNILFSIAELFNIVWILTWVASKSWTPYPLYAGWGTRYSGHSTSCDGQGAWHN